MCELPDGTLLLALADGAGSAPRADEGAHCAANVALTTLAETVTSTRPDASNWGDALRHVFRQARRALDETATDLGCQVADLATTLVCVAATTETVAAAQIGDGFVVGSFGDGVLSMLLSPRRGEYANIATFLTSGSVDENVDIAILESPAEEIAASTDGLLRLCVNLREGTPYGPFFKPLLAFASEAEDAVEASEQLADFLNSDRISQRTDDDKTLVLAARSPRTVSALQLSSDSDAPSSVEDSNSDTP
jgi:hypothetical protein